MSLPFTSIRRLGNAIVLAALAALFVMVAIVCVGAPLASAQSPLEKLVSPGKLSDAHVKQEAECGSCHASFNKSAQSILCLNCHKDVASDISGRVGLHGRWSKVRGVECKTCHTEHKGRARDIAPLDALAFDHRMTDYPLEGGHREAKCESCHSGGKKFREAPIDCVGCHAKADPHQGKLGAVCADCHSANAWSAVSFDHVKTGFALLGKHATADCMSCHKGEVWKNLPDTCVGCHKTDDVHKGELGADCASCHGPSGWKVEKFNHARTGFPLLGAHATTNCEGCHKVSLTAAIPRDCVGCHASDDVHKRSFGTTCADCHSASEWSKIKFDHTDTRFPLKGKHATSTCESCHSKPMDSWTPPLTCVGCHAEDDVHRGLLGPECVDCHAEKAWATVRFDHARDAKFSLNGKHAEAKCEACHEKPVYAHSPPVSCAGCHEADDPHEGQLGGSCGTCHGEADWKKAIRFDHDLAAFPLLGKHAKTDCVSCHRTPAYLDAPKDCAGCHVDDDIHKTRLGDACATCHNPTSWARWSFNHDKQTTYQLTGKHRQAACESCHRESTKGKIELSTRCVACHSSDDKHRGSFGSSCERCHTTEAFWAVEVNR